MSLAKILDHLQSGDIIVHAGSVPASRMRPQLFLQARAELDDGNQSRKLLRSLIVARLGGGKK